MQTNWTLIGRDLFYILTFLHSFHFIFLQRYFTLSPHKTLQFALGQFGSSQMCFEDPLHNTAIMTEFRRHKVRGWEWVCMCVCMCVCKREGKRDRLRAKGGEKVSVLEWERERECVYMCVCIEREMEKRIFFSLKKLMPFFRVSVGVVKNHFLCKQEKDLKLFSLIWTLS